MVSHSGRSLNLPRLGLSFPERIFSAVDFPIPFVPTSPRTCKTVLHGSVQARERVYCSVLQEHVNGHPISVKRICSNQVLHMRGATTCKRGRRRET